MTHQAKAPHLGSILSIAIIGDWECEAFQQNKAQLLLRQDAFAAHISKDGFKECRKSELSLN